MKVPASQERLERLLRESGEAAFAAGFSRRVVERLNRAVEPGEAELYSLWTWRHFQRVALVASLLLVAVAAWNLQSAGKSGHWLDRVLNLPAATLDNSLTWSQQEDVS